MINNINLIRDRAERPPTTIERFLFTILLALFCTYAVTLGLAVLFYQGVNHRTRLLKNQIERLRSHPVLEDPERDLSDEVIEKIHTLEKIIIHHEKRWEWNERLQALQEHMPEGVFLVSFTGQKGEQMRFRGYADDSDDGGSQKVRKFVVNLQDDRTFMQGLADVSLQSTRSVSEPAFWERTMRFDIICRSED